MEISTRKSQYTARQDSALTSTLTTNYVKISNGLSAVVLVVSEGFIYHCLEDWHKSVPPPRLHCLYMSPLEFGQQRQYGIVFAWWVTTVYLRTNAVLLMTCQCPLPVKYVESSYNTLIPVQTREARTKDTHVLLGIDYDVFWRHHQNSKRKEKHGNNRFTCFVGYDVNLRERQIKTVKRHNHESPSCLRMAIDEISANKGGACPTSDRNGSAVMAATMIFF